MPTAYDFASLVVRASDLLLLGSLGERVLRFTARPLATDDALPSTPVTTCGCAVRRGLDAVDTGVVGARLRVGAINGWCEGDY